MIASPNLYCTYLFYKPTKPANPTFSLIFLEIVPGREIFRSQNSFISNYLVIFLDVTFMSFWIRRHFKKRQYYLVKYFPIWNQPFLNRNVKLSNFLLKIITIDDQIFLWNLFRRLTSKISKSHGHLPDLSAEIKCVWRKPCACKCHLFHE